MQEILPLIISSFIAAFVSAIVSSIYTRAKSVTQKQIESQKAFQQGMRALLWGELKQMHSEAQLKGGLDTEERHQLENVYNAYHALGGNGTGTRLHEEAMNLPVLTDNKG